MVSRKGISLALLLVFIVVSVTGFMVHLSGHAGRDAGALGGSSAAVADDAHMRRGHELAGYLFIVLGLLHLTLNRRTMLAHFGLNGKGGTGR